MADGTKIEWCDATWNPITGCSVVSPGCTNCYAMKLAGTRLKHTPSRRGLTRDSKAGPVWTGEVRLNEQWLDQPLRWRRARKIFVCAHGDLFAETVPDEWIVRVVAISIAGWLLNEHTLQILTKRAGRLRRLFSDAAFWEDVNIRIADLVRHHYDPLTIDLFGPGNMPAGLWLGVSAEDQARTDERIPELLATPAAVRFVSAEPLLGPIDPHGLTGLDWIIVGGESGPGARPMHPAWVCSIRDQCAKAGVAFFFKQWGEWAPNIGAVNGWTIDDDPEISRFDHREWRDGRWSDVFRPMWCDLQDGNYDKEQTVSRIGKRRAGRLLDGVEHSAIPQTSIFSMSDLRFERSTTTDAFAAELSALEVTLPLRLSEEDVGVVFDANGRTVCIVDVWGNQPDEQASAIASWIVGAVNTCGGYRAELVQ